ncbi:GNAT family N-acetyltransferase [Jatrophihabitans sp. DSM 45814]
MTATVFDPATILRGPLTVLRNWAPEDADEVYLACQDSEIQRWTQVPSPYGRDDAEGFVNSTAERWAAGLPSFAIVDPAGNQLLGSIGFPRSPGEGVLEIGYWVSPWARGRGVATAAVGQLCQWTFAQPGIERIEWQALVGNEASRKVAEHCGFRHEGILRSRAKHNGVPADLWIASLLRTDLSGPM